MVDKPRRQGVQLEVAHAVAAHNHSRLLFVEGIDHLLQRVRRRIQVVRVQLHGKASATRVVDGYIPAPANAEVGTLRNDNVEFVVMP